MARTPSRTLLPMQIKPQLATLAERAPSGDDWIHEIKFDGYRMMARLEDGDVTLYTRNGHDWTHRFRELAHELSQLPTTAALLDGEVVAQRISGASNFGDLQQALSKGRTASLAYQVFDLLFLDVDDLVRLPLLERKEALERLIVRDNPGWPRIRYTEHIVGQGQMFYEHGCKVGLEGIISKRGRAQYRSGRTKTWLKIKCTAHEELVVGGYTEPSGARGGFGALILGAFDNTGRLQYAGRVGTGFTAKMIDSIYNMLARTETSESPFAEALPVTTRTPVHWVRPEMVVEVEYTERTREGALRHATFRGVREDRDAEEIRWEPGDAD